MKQDKTFVASKLLPAMQLGSSVAEFDDLLENARVETSVFHDLLSDHVDLIPGTKGSGKTALFRMFTEFLPDILLSANRVVVAHGVRQHGDTVFHVFTEQFDKLTEDDFVSFWSIYLVSLAREQFIKNPEFEEHLKEAKGEIREFNSACNKARVPDTKANKSLRDILQWALHAVRKLSPTLKYRPEGDLGEFELTLSEPEEVTQDETGMALPAYMPDIRRCLDKVLEKAGLSVWLMVDRLDEIFPRRTDVERRALRGLLRSMTYLRSDRIRIKIFLRDDMLESVVSGPEGFTALTHVTARQADRLQWSEDGILLMIVKRIFASEFVCDSLKVHRRRLEISRRYREEAFYKVFPDQVHAGKRQSSTLRWIYNHTRDGRGVVTPRDVIDLVTRAAQRQREEFLSDAEGTADWVIGPRAVEYGLAELSKKKRDTFLKAEFPHLWPVIEKFVGGKSEYEKETLAGLLGDDWAASCEDLLSIGFLEKVGQNYKIPQLFRTGLELTQGKATA